MNRRDILKIISMFFWLALLPASVGCHHLPWSRTMGTPSPVVFTGPPSANDVVRALNSNIAPIRQLHAESASVSAAGYPPLRANLDFERPHKFRLRAQLIGPVLDLGSNDELFWLWLKHNPQPAVYFARHDRFAVSPVRQVLPIDPLWFTEALGVVQLDPLAKYEGPIPVGPGRFELRARVPAAGGEQTRVWIVDDKHGWVLEQRLFDARNQLLASAKAMEHRHYPAENVSLPHRVDIQIPPAQLAMSISVTNYQINSLFGDPAQLWVLPQFEGYPLVDLADPNTRLSATEPPRDPLPSTWSAASPATQPVAQPGAVSPLTNSPDSVVPYSAPAVSQSPRYRGYSSIR